MISISLLPKKNFLRGILPESCQEQLEISVSWRFYVTCAVRLFIYTLLTVTICCYQLWVISLDLSHQITGSLASQYLTRSVIGGCPIYSVNFSTIQNRLPNKIVAYAIFVLVNFYDFFAVRGKGSWFINPFLTHFQSRGT